MANKQRDLTKETRWRELLAKHASSGLSVRAFCHQEQLTESSFYAWRRTLGERSGAKPKSAQVELVPVKVTGQRSASIAIELAGGLVLRLPESTSAH